MKRTYVIFLAAISGIIAGCNDKGVETPRHEEQLSMKTITVEGIRADSGDDTSGTRATIGDGYATVWEESDEIIFFAESYVNKCGHQCLTSIEVSEDLQYARFRGEVVAPDVTDTYYAAHPATAVVTNTHASFEIPAVQEATASPKILMCAKLGPASVEGLSFHFSPVDAFLHIKLSGTAADITRIVMEAFGGEDLAGTYTYSFDDETTSVAGSKSITVNTGGLTDFYVMIPAVTLSSGYKLTYYNAGGEQMMRTYGYGNAKVFGKGDIAKVEVSSFEAVSLTYNNGFKSSYDYYKIGDIWTANTMGGNIIHGTGVHEVSYNTTGISSTLISEIGVVLDGNKIPCTDDTWSKSAKTFAVGDHTVSWGDHTAQLYMIYDGGREVRSEIRTISVTGLPYYAAPPTKADGWRELSGKSNSWGSSNVRLATSSVPAPSISSPSFHIPENINVYVTSLITTDTTIALNFSITINGTKLVDQKTGSFKSQSFPLKDLPGTFSPSGNTAVFASNAAVAGQKTYVNDVYINYR